MLVIESELNILLSLPLFQQIPALQSHVSQPKERQLGFWLANAYGTSGSTGLSDKTV